ncbi:hypothetical protein J3459_008649 [Metarhizium acridum]|nr:hypothetical protein J3459_008649 [Metarhizium acridum]
MQQMLRGIYYWPEEPKYKLETAMKNKPLHWAAEHKALAAMKKLINAGAWVNVEDKLRRSPLCYAAAANYPEMVGMLLKAGASTEIDQGTPTQIAALGGAHEIVRRLLDKGADATKGYGIYGSPLNAAVRGVTRRVGNLDAYLKTVRVILERDKDGDILNHEAGKYGTALQAAASGGVGQMIDLLPDCKPELDVLSGQFGTPLHAAVYHRNIEAIDRLMKREKENFFYGTVDHEGRLPFHIAASRGGRLIRWLIASSADHVLDRDFQGRHTMHFAAASGSYLVCEMSLAKYKEALKDNDCDGWTPLNWACRQGKLEIIELLIQRRADRNKPSLRMWKPIDVATYFKTCSA